MCRVWVVRPSDLKRHKCLIERAKPVEQEKNAVQYGGCQKWFCSKGSLALHRYEEENSTAL